MTRALNIWLAALSLLAAICTGSAATARADAKRVTVLKFKGPSAAAFEAQVTRALKQRDEVELVAAREVQTTVNRLGNSLESDGDYREVGEALELSAFIEGEVSKKGRNLEASVRVRDADSGAVVHEETWTRKRSKIRTLRPVVWSALGPAIARTSPPTPQAKPEPEPEKPARATTPAESPRARARPARRSDDDERPRDAEARPRRADGKSTRHPALVAAAGPELMWRTLTYTGDTNFNTYKNEAGSPAFNLALRLEYYPGAHVSSDWYSDLGLDLNLAYTIGLKSKQNDEELATSAYDLGIGAVWRFYWGDFEPRLRVGYVKQVFDVDVPPETLLPAIDYSAVRLGVGTAVNLTESFALDVSFAYLAVLGMGELEEPKYGEDVEGRGWEAGAGALLRLKDAYGLRLGLEYRRYVYDFGLSDSTDNLRLPRDGRDGYLKLSLSFVYYLAGAAQE